MVRAPRYEKTGLKKGAWSPEEDQKLIDYIKRYRIWTWSEMAKPAGLSRSGKSCRLRWVNYLKPGIKHGNFSKEEAEAIVKLHELLGNRWSAIAAKLPGRTDNEIKNYWHTRLKKCVKDSPMQRTLSEAQKASSSEANQKKFSESNPLVPNALEASNLKGSRDIPVSPQLSTADFSSSSTDPTVAINEIKTVDQNIGSQDQLSTGEFSSSSTDPTVAINEIHSMEQNMGSHDQLSTGDFSSSSIDATIAINEIHPVEQNIGSLETFGELQILWPWAEPFSVEDLYTVENHLATFADPGYISSTSQSWIQEQTSPVSSLETFGGLQSSWAEPFLLENLYAVEDQATFADSRYISSTSQTCMQEKMNPFGSLETFGGLQSSCAEQFAVKNSYLQVEDGATFVDSAYVSPTHQSSIHGSYNDTGIDFWVRLYMEAEMGEIQ